MTHSRVARDSGTCERWVCEQFLWSQRSTTRRASKPSIAAFAQPGIGPRYSPPDRAFYILDIGIACLILEERWHRVDEGVFASFPAAGIKISKLHREDAAEQISGGCHAG